MLQNMKIVVQSVYKVYDSLCVSVMHSCLIHPFRRDPVTNRSTRAVIIHVVTLMVLFWS